MENGKSSPTNTPSSQAIAPNPGNSQGNGAVPPGPPNPGAEAGDGPEKRKFSLDDYEYKATAAGGAFRQRLTVPEGKPGSDVFWRIDPRPEMKKVVSILEYKPIQDAAAIVYLVRSDLAELIGKRVKPAVLRVCVCRPAIVRLWAVKIPDADLGRAPNGYTSTTWEAVERAEKVWLRMEQNDAKTGYDIYPAEVQWPDPPWPAESLSELAEKAYGARYVDSLAHEVLDQLKGRS